LGQIAAAGCSKELFSGLIDAGEMPVMRPTFRRGVPAARASFARWTLAGLMAVSLGLPNVTDAARAACWPLKIRSLRPCRRWQANIPPTSNSDRPWRLAGRLVSHRGWTTRSSTQRPAMGKVTNSVSERPTRSIDHRRTLWTSPRRIASTNDIWPGRDPDASSPTRSSR
jgi:hypothetical protein